MLNRRIKILFGAIVSLYMTLVCFNNIVDYGSNYTFVSMVTGMDDVFSRDHNAWRSIHSPVLWHGIYILIIVLEASITIMTAIGTVHMFRNLTSAPSIFNASKSILISGIALGVLLWFGVFITIAGEWFLMWQSKDWNGQQTAFSLAICFLLFLLYINSSDD